LSFDPQLRSVGRGALLHYAAASRAADLPVRNAGFFTPTVDARTFPTNTRSPNRRDAITMPRMAAVHPCGPAHNAPARLDITRDRYDAVLFDLDGVLTSTAEIHAAAWKQMFDEYLRRRAKSGGEPFREFDIGSDYRQYVDGRPRYEGVQQFLQSREIRLPRGTPDSPDDEESVCGLGNMKDRLVHKAIEAGRVKSFPGSVTFLRLVRERGLHTAVVTSSRNCSLVLKAAGLDGLFDTQVDGRTIEDEGLAGKPAPDSFLRAAERLGVTPARAVVIEDAISGVQAGRDGRFALVIGVDRHGDADALCRNGAHVVVNDLSELLPTAAPPT
jgi:beta-phosphoglucomutase family hydrolase